MGFSFRARMTVLMCLAVACAVGFSLYETRTQVEQATLAMERQTFMALLHSNAENLDAMFLRHLSQDVLAITARKHQLREAAARARALWRSLCGDTPTTADRARYATLCATMDAEAQGTQAPGAEPLRMEVLDTAAIFSGTTSPLGVSARLRDVMQRDLRQILATLPHSGDFAVTRMPVSSAGAPQEPPFREHPVLLFLLPLHAPVPGKLPPEVLVVVSNLDDIQHLSRDMYQRGLDALAERFQSTHLYTHGLLQLYDANGNLLLQKGSGSLPPGILDSARGTAHKQGVVFTTVTNGQEKMHCLVGHIRTFDWYIAMGAPAREVRMPLDSLLRRLLMFGLGVMVVVGGGVLLVHAHVMRPLHLLTEKARQFAAVDFSTPAAVEHLEPLMAEGLPLQRRDELGQLARALAHMGSSLSQNIRTLMVATASKERLEGELNAAREIQMGILSPPDSAPDLPGFAVAAFIDPAREVGGDLYDFFRIPDGKWVLILGDVSDKGVPAALFMAMTVTLARYALHANADPASAMRHINDMLAERNPGNMFVTLFLAVYDPDSGHLSYANGGHCPPRIVSSGGDAPPRVLEQLSGPVVGVFPGQSYTAHHTRLEEGETCLIFSDGVTEAMDADKQLYGEQRLAHLMTACRGYMPRALLAQIHAAVRTFRGTAQQSDDIAMLAFCRRAGHGTPERGNMPAQPPNETPGPQPTPVDQGSLPPSREG